MSQISRLGRVYEIPEETVYIPEKCTIDFKDGQITIIGREPEDLTNELLILLAYFYINRNQFLSNIQILEYMFPSEEEIRGTDNRLKDMVCRLRKSLNDSKPFTIIINKRERGYKLVLSADGQVSFSPIGKEPSTDSVDNNNLETVSVRSKKSRINLKIHSRNIWDVNNIKTALGLLVEAKDIRQIKLSRLQIYRAIDMFFRAIETPYSKNIIDYNDNIWEKYEKEFFQIVYNCKKEIEIADQPSELIDIKLQLLDNIMTWRFLIIMLRTQLDLERQAFEMSADLIDKETWQTKINKLDEDYQLGREKADIEERMLDEMINEYEHDLAATKSSI